MTERTYKGTIGYTCTIDCTGWYIKDKNGNLRPVVELFAEINKAADKKFDERAEALMRFREEAHTT